MYYAVKKDILQVFLIIGQKHRLQHQDSLVRNIRNLRRRKKQKPI